MAKQPLRVATRRFALGHVFLWMSYAVVVFAVTRFADSAAFGELGAWRRLGIALLPSIPVAAAFYVMGRFASRSPDPLGPTILWQATATAGVVLFLIVFAQGWVELLAGPEAWPRVTVHHADLTPWLLASLFGLVWAAQFFRLARRAVH